MKRSIILLVAGVMAFGLASCGAAEGATEKVTYSITADVLGEGGKKNVTLSLENSQGDVVATGVTPRGGKLTLEAPKGEYTVVASDLPAGYYQVGEVKTSEDALEYTVNISTRLIDGTPEAGSTFYKGDVLYDHTFNMVDGTTTSISSQLAKYDAVIINFWGIECGVCIQELPELNEYYVEMQDKVGLICVNSYSGDTDDEIAEFVSNNDYIIPSTVYDYSYSDELRVSGWPTTVVVDRYGRYAAGMVGFVTGVEDFFHNMVDGLLGDSYVPQY